MSGDLRLVWPSREYLPGYLDALTRGWSPDNVRGELARLEELGKIAADADAFLAGLVDREARGEPIRLATGERLARIPGYRKWMWDGAFVGTIGFRWQPGTSALPDYVLGHIGYAVVPWKRGLGYATRALQLLLPEARAEGLDSVDLTVEPANLASRRVIEANGGVLVEEFNAGPRYGNKTGLRYRIAL
ncbi:MAG: GNAT family N-acetyltransferase [Vicinamibacterales bacterium]